MTRAQLYLAIGLPVFAAAMNMVGGILQTDSINARITTLESALGSRMGSLDNSLNARVGSLDARFETLIGKIIKVDKRLTLSRRSPNGTNRIGS